MSEKKRIIYVLSNVLALIFLATSVLLLFTTYGSSFKGAIQRQEYIESTEVKEEIISKMEQVIDNILVVEFVWRDRQNKRYSNEYVMEFISENGESTYLSIKEMIDIGKGNYGIQVLYNKGLVDKYLNCHLSYINWIYGPIYVEKKVPLLTVMQLLDEMYRTYMNAELELEQMEVKPSNLMYFIAYKDSIYTNSAFYWEKIQQVNAENASQSRNPAILSQVISEEIQYCYVHDKTYLVQLEMEMIYNTLRHYMGKPTFSKLGFIEEFLKKENILDSFETIDSYVYGQLDWELLEFWRGAAIGIAFDTSLRVEDSFITFDKQYALCKKWAIALTSIAGIGSIVWLVTLCIILWDNKKIGRKMALEKEKNVAFVETMSKIDKLPSETVWGIALGFCFLSFLSMQLPIGYITEHHYAIVDVGNIFGYYKMQGFWIFFLYVFLSSLWYLIFLRLIKRYIIRKEIGMHFKDSSHMVYFLKFLRDVYRNRSVTIQTAAELMLYGLGNYLNIVCLFPKGGFYLIIFWINFILIQGTLLSVFLNRSIWQKRITETLGHMTQGDVGVKVDTTNMKGTILQLAEEINYLGSGLEKAIEKATINERMKTELLTNVSHDIKTPLTSIVNYVDLLKMTNLSDKKAMEYLKILEEKSIRLKQLTEDLVEAAKANSGNLILEMVSLDLTEFLHQVIGEMEYKFLEKNLEVVALIPDEPIFIEADGNRLWRVFENLMNNAYKYSMSGTRVFVECLEKEEEVSVVIKNISKYPLNLRGSELTERFVRGDASRATEGSGLGLSIARGFIERMDGVLEIKADGDMFKAMVHFKRNSGLL